MRRRIYLDYAAATPVRKEVARVMAPYARMHFANASAVHREGQIARDAVETSRATVASILRIRKSEVYFTSGGTESNTLAVAGVLEALLRSGRAPESCEVLTTSAEHPSLTGVLSRYEKRGVVVHRVSVSGEGLMDLAQFKTLLSPHTVLVTYAYANSETGVVQDVKALSRIVRAHRALEKKIYPFVHLDASQAPLYLSCAFDSLGVDMMTLDAGKFYGPKGVGVLAKKQAVPLVPIFAGGDQEEGMRPGTEHVGAFVGFAEAFRVADSGREKRTKRVTALRDYAIEMLLREIPGAILNGSREQRIANNINISIPGIDGEYAAVVLDHHGFAVSTKSACSGASGSGSHVIYAMGGDDARALSTLRITLGEETSRRNIDAMVRVVKAHVTMMRAAYSKNIDQTQK